METPNLNSSSRVNLTQDQESSSIHSADENQQAEQRSSRKTSFCMKFKKVCNRMGFSRPETVMMGLGATALIGGAIATVLTGGVAPLAVAVVGAGVYTAGAIGAAIRTYCRKGSAGSDQTSQTSSQSPEVETQSTTDERPSTSGVDNAGFSSDDEQPSSSNTTTVLVHPQPDAEDTAPPVPPRTVSLANNRHSVSEDEPPPPLPPRLVFMKNVAANNTSSSESSDSEDEAARPSTPSSTSSTSSTSSSSSSAATPRSTTPPPIAPKPTGLQSGLLTELAAKLAKRQANNHDSNAASSSHSDSPAPSTSQASQGSVTESPATTPAPSPVPPDTTQEAAFSPEDEGSDRFFSPLRGNNAASSAPVVTQAALDSLSGEGGPVLDNRAAKTKPRGPGNRRPPTRSSRL